MKNKFYIAVWDDDDEELSGFELECGDDNTDLKKVIDGAKKAVVELCEDNRDNYSAGVFEVRRVKTLDGEYTPKAVVECSDVDQC